ncbi:GNAT family N-acetyltransferase [Aestuariibacter sp. A3R04]|uniref:GNAT family N-acetyltransferase n=1 Tax=Aestuariibacter sp. A3R04 TaxID=2841571 RepID=UPI002091418B|nr:GNAT family N-acetyltransferase [Aestuariibacter sp. A3R04]
MNLYIVGDTGLPVESILPVIAELRTEMSGVSLAAQIRRQMASGYEMIAALDDGQAVAVCGFTTGEKLAWGKHIYIDDLVTVSHYQGQGAGKLLLDTVIDLAKERGCQSVHLDSGVQRFDAHRFYLRNGFFISSHHFALTL